MRTICLLIVALFLTGFTAACGAGTPDTIGTRVQSGSAETLQPLLDEAAAILPTSRAGVAVAVMNGEETSIGFAGNPTFDENTLFELGSITKVMTANLLAQLADEGVVALDDSVNLYLPAALQAPQWEPVTLANLATHSAGLPRLPQNLGLLSVIFSGSVNNPYAHYDVAKLYEGLSKVKVGEVGGAAEYSNLGAGWLGTILSQATGEPYAELARERLFMPMGMTTATMSGWANDNIAPPLDSSGREVSNWDFDALAGAGAARGSLQDALAFLRASMGACDAAVTDRVARANCLTQQATGHRLSDNTETGLGWLLSTRPGGTAVWHNGGTGGYRTFLGFNPENKTGIILLSNDGNLDEVDKIGLRYLVGME